MRAARAVIVVAGVGVAACSFVYAVDLDDARRTDREAGSPLADAGGSSDAAAASDASDAAGPPAGGGPDGSSSVRWCSSLSPPARYCDDFDQAPALVGEWRTRGAEGTTDRILLDDATFRSAPRSMLTEVRDGAPCRYVRLEQTFDGLGTHRQSIEATIRPQRPWTGDHPILALYFDQGGPAPCEALYFLNGNESEGLFGSHLYLQKLPAEDDVQGAPPRFDEWTGIRVVGTDSSLGLVVELTLTPPTGIGRTITANLTDCKPGARLMIGLGFHCASGVGTMRYDDVRVDWE